MSAEDFWHLIESHPKLTRMVLKQIVGTVRQLSARVYQNKALGIQQRVCEEILHLARQTKPEGNRAVINNMPTHQDIANRIGSHREAVTKAFSSLKQSSLIQRTGRKLIVPDMQKLIAKGKER